MTEYMRRMKMMLTFTLLMIPGALSFSVTGYTGGAVTITCHYESGYSTNAKYFCRLSADLTQKCSDLIKTNITNKWFKSGRFSLYDDTTASVFNVTITDLNEHDSDTYYCAVDRSLWDIYTEVILNVTEDTTDHKTSPPTTTSSSPSSPSSFLSSFPSVQSTLVMTSSSSTFSKNQSAVTSASPERSSDTLLIMSLSVVLVLIIIGLLLMTVILYKRHQTAVTRSQAGPVHKEQISRASCDYTEVKDIRGDEVCSTDSPNTVYAMVQSPTIPSDAIITVYDTAQLPTIPSDFNNTVYSSARLPTIPSVGSDLVRLRNSLDSCEYSTVNHWDT
ncbi:CMRF35-like molecule 2 isoform X3 [Triplophysa dalaica]|uniref:CMRF35-like molecule 2 isoform X3 n=1 Tax=Triplophysa dalaica TaxID=1582913 RepID=UPI0024DFB869|nr:CMRF35-like molecule 2 isoform X3 [Triplophysa dalaica]